MTIPLKFGPNWLSCIREVFTFFPLMSYVTTLLADGVHLAWWEGSSDTIQKGYLPRTIPSKFGRNWPTISEKITKQFSHKVLCLNYVGGLGN